MSKKHANPLGLEGVTPEERERLSAANDAQIMTMAKATPIASLPLAGPLRNPGFEVRPWVARPEITQGKLGMYCPTHLHIYTEPEMDEAHYPFASRDKFGQLNKFCWACGRPAREDGLSGMNHKGTGKPCPACGFKRKRVMTPKALAALQKGQGLLQQAYAEGHKGPDAWAHVKEIAPRDGVAEVVREKRELRRGQNGANSLTELMRMKAEERAEKILKPYFESLDLDVKDDWSPSTKLEFYNGQTAIAEKLLNRLEGLPVARHRHVDKDDADVLPEGELSPRVVARLVASILAGTDPGELVQDAEFEEVQ